MTDRERFVRALTFQSVDRVPRLELCLWGQTYRRWLEEGLPSDALPDTDFFPGSEFFGLDRRDYIPVRTGLLPGYGYQVLEETDRYVIACHDHGGVTKALKTGVASGTRECMDQHLRAPVTDLETFRDYQSRLNPDSPARYPRYLASRAREWNARDCSLQLLTNGAFGFYSHARTMMDTEGLSIAFHEQPSLVHALMDHLEYFITALIERVFASGVEVDVFNFFEDMAYKTAPLLSPATFREFIFPHYCRVCELLRKHGVQLISVDTDGNSEPLFPLLIEAGVNVIWPLEQAADHTNPLQLRREYGRDLAFMGAVDKRALFTDHAAIDYELETKIAPLLEQGGFIPILDHAVSPDISYDNWLYYLERKHALLG